VATTYLWVRFPDTEPAEAGVSAKELRQFILDAQPEAAITSHRDDEGAMDGGTGLLIEVLDTFAKAAGMAAPGAIITAVFSAIREWQKARGNKRVAVEPVDAPPTGKKTKMK
jgi:hypothetical protein